MLASMCKLKVGRLSREVGFFSMMLMFTFFDVSDDHEDYMCDADMEFVQKFTPPDFKAKNFTPSISPYFNSFSGKKHKK